MNENNNEVINNNDITITDIVKNYDLLNVILNIY
jgi:hypothetical protein